MKILAWNTRGLGDKTKRVAIKRSLKRLNPDLALIQETKKDHFDIDTIKDCGAPKTLAGRLWRLLEGPEEY